MYPNSFLAPIEACAAILGQCNKLNLFNDALLVQELLEGGEFVCNTVSLDRKPYVTDIWKYTKRPSEDGSASFIYDTMELLPFNGEVQKRLRHYAFRGSGSPPDRERPRAC